MIIREIQEISKSKVKIVLEDEFAFCLYKGELRSYKLKQGEDISQDILEKIVNEVLTKRAKLRAMHLLEKRDYTEYKLREKLAENGYPKSIVDIAVDYVKAYGYVDDFRYACSYINYASSNKSKRQMEQDLMKKGISKDIIQQSLEDSIPDDNNEEELIRKLLVKKHYNFGEECYENKKKMIAFLYRKGFNLDKIYKVIDLDSGFFET